MKESRTRNQAPHNRPIGPLLIVLSGPSGVGKDAFLNRIKSSGYPLEVITTITTRPQRPKERDAVDYHFISTEQFQEMIMPIYDYRCKKCNNEFSVVMTISEHEKKRPSCSSCGSKSLEQKITSFNVQTSKKS